jgi:hypothetical protein
MTDNNQSPLWKPTVEMRIKKLEDIYTDWTLRHWKFTGDVNNDNKLNATPHTVVEVMRQASISYILGQFNATILLSSVAVEKILHFLMDLNGLHDEVSITERQINNYSPIEVQTVEGIKYFGFWKNRFGEFFDKGNGTWSFYEFESLNPSIDAVEKIGYDIGEMDKKVGGIDKKVGAKHRLFVLRRDTLVHGNYEGLALIQQIADIENQKYKNQDDLIDNISDLFDKHETQAFEQYEAASKFIISVFKKFDSTYEYIA